MTAVVVNRPGGHEVLEYKTDVPIPSRKPGEVLVKLHSSSVNPVDSAVRQGVVAPESYPKILGGDVAGEVVEADEGSKFKKGDRVAALTYGYWTSPFGTYAQYASVEEKDLALLPASVPLDIAAGLPLAGLTAKQALEVCSPGKGQRVLIFTASGGVGHLAVQVAKAQGLYVVGVAGPNNTAWVREQLKADEVVDYRSQDFAQLYADKPFDIIIDLLANDAERTKKLLSVLKPDGHYSHIQNPGTDHAGLKKIAEDHQVGKGPASHLIIVAPNGPQLTQLYELWDSGLLKLEVAKVFPLDQVADAHKQVETGHTRGKVVLAIPQ
eukprot:gene2603-2905_t